MALGILVGGLSFSHLVDPFAFGTSHRHGVSRLAMRVRGAKPFARSGAGRGTGARGLAGLVFVPTYVLWKLMLLVRHRARSDGEWVRTAREEEEAP